MSAERPPSGNFSLQPKGSNKTNVYQNKIRITEKIAVHIFDEYRYKNSQDNISKPNPNTSKTMTKLDSSQGHKDGLKYTNECDTPLSTKEKTKPT